MAGETFNMDLGSQQLDFFKHYYGPISENLFNSENVTHGRIKKDFNNFVGDEYRPANRLSFQGGFGAGSLPKAGGKRGKQAVVKTKRVYQRISLRREAIKASMGNKGAFVRATKESIRGGVESYARNCSRILFSDGTGILGRGVGGTPDATRNVTALAADPVNGHPARTRIVFGNETVCPWVDARFEEEDQIQLVTGLNAADNKGGMMEPVGTDFLTVYRVFPEDRVIEVTGTSALLAAHAAVPRPLPTDQGFCMQRSYMEEPHGLLNIVQHPSQGMLYEIPIQRRWSSTQTDADGNTISIPIIRQHVLDIHKKFGNKVGKLICTSYLQYNRLLEMLGDDTKRYNINARTMKSSKLNAKTSFSGISLMTEAGEIGIFFERFCPDDRMFIINDNYIKVPTRPGQGWFNDDGRVLLRESDEDSYEARYGGYWNNYIVPSAQGVIYNLATT